MKKLPFTIVLVFCLLPGFAQTEGQIKPKFEKREGAATGARPCKYEGLARPSVLVNPERLAWVRQQVLHKRSESRAVYEKHVKANADSWLRRSITIPATGGWIHDFFCTEGSMLQVPENRVFDPQAPSICPKCGKAYLNDKVLAARRSFEHYWLSGAVRDLSLVYAIEEQKAYADKAIEMLTRYADAYADGPIMRQTLEEAVLLIPLAESYDLLYDAMSPAQRGHIEQQLFWPAAQALTKAGMGGNWGSWHLSAIGVIGYATRHQRFIDFATQQFKAQIKNQLGDDGLWPESVHTYHFYPLSGFLAFAEAAANHGDDLYNWEAKPGKSLKKMFTAPLRYVYPNMRLAAINDGWYDSFLPQDQYVMAYHRYRLPEFAWAVQQIRQGGRSGAPGDFLDPHYRNVLYGEPLPARKGRPALASLDFPVLGIAVLRQGRQADQEMMMTFDYGPFLGHGHPDKMNFTLFAKGQLMIPDYGTTGYGSAANQFLKSTLSHNTLVVDGKDQPRTKDRELVAFIDKPGFKLASARTAAIAPGSSWTRTVMMTEDYALVWDRVAGTGKHQYDWFFHAEGHALAVSGASGKAASVPQPAGNFSYQFITEVQRQALLADAGRAQWDWDDYGLGVWFSHQQGQTIFTAKMPTDEGRRVPLMVLRHEGAQAEFLAVLKPMKGNKEKLQAAQVQFEQVAAGETLVKISFGKRQDQIRLGQTGVSYRKNGAAPLMVDLPRN